MENIASTWYNDLTGTISLDESNFCSFKDFCKIICELKIPQDQKPIGIDMQISNEHGHAGFYLNIICRDTKNNYFRYDVEDVKGVDILNLFRHVHIVMFKRFEEKPNIDINDLEPIYQEDVTLCEDVLKMRTDLIRKHLNALNAVIQAMQTSMLQ